MEKHELMLNKSKSIMIFCIAHYVLFPKIKKIVTCCRNTCMHVKHKIRLYCLFYYIYIYNNCLKGLNLRRLFYGNK